MTAQHVVGSAIRGRVAIRIRIVTLTMSWGVIRLLPQTHRHEKWAIMFLSLPLWLEPTTSHTHTSKSELTLHLIFVGAGWKVQTTKGD